MRSYHFNEYGVKNLAEQLKALLKPEHIVTNTGDLHVMNLLYYCKECENIRNTKHRSERVLCLDKDSTQSGKEESIRLKNSWFRFKEIARNKDGIRETGWMGFNT